MVRIVEQMTASPLITLPMEEGTTLTVNSQSSHTIMYFLFPDLKSSFKLANILQSPLYTLKAQFKSSFLDKDRVVLEYLGGSFS